MTVTILGVDPGFTGALALYNPQSGRLQLVDMPTFRLRGKQLVDRYALAGLLRAAHLKLAVVEAVGPRKGEGPAGAFSFGRGLGHVEGVLAGLGIPVLPAEPGVWKGSMGLSSDKALSRQRAQIIFREHEMKFMGKSDAAHGRAEAALLAYYGARFLATAGGGR